MSAMTAAAFLRAIGTATGAGRQAVRRDDRANRKEIVMRLPVRELAHVRNGVLAGTLALLAGCATPPPPTEALAQAGDAFAAAQDAGTEEFAPGLLLRAQEKLDLGAVAAGDRRYADARRLAEEATIDARLAVTTARAREARHAVSEVEAQTQALKDAMARTVRPGTP